MICDQTVSINCHNEQLIIVIAIMMVNMVMTATIGPEENIDEDHDDESGESDYNEYLLPHTLHSLYFNTPRHPWGQHSKFYVSYSTYPYMAYPDYCLGWIVAATLPTIETLLQEV